MKRAPKYGVVSIGGDTYRRLRAYCAANHVTMSSLVTSLLRDIDPAAPPPAAPLDSSNWRLGQEASR